MGELPHSLHASKLESTPLRVRKRVLCEATPPRLSHSGASVNQCFRARADAFECAVQLPSEGREVGRGAQAVNGGPRKSGGSVPGGDGLVPGGDGGQVFRQRAQGGDAARASTAAVPAGSGARRRILLPTADLSSALLGPPGACPPPSPTANPSRGGCDAGPCDGSQRGIAP